MPKGEGREMRTTLTDGHRRYSVNVRRSEWSPTPGGEVAPANTVGEFLHWFRQRGIECRSSCPPFDAEDAGIAKRLLLKHGEMRLKELATYFWHWHSEPLAGRYTHTMRLFAAKIPELEIALQ
jgi:hypothetical protein